MLEWIPVALKGVDTIDKTRNELSSLLKGKKGAKRAILDEIQHNSTTCWLYVNRNADLADVVLELRHNVYDQLSLQGFNFNSLKKKKIRSYPSLKTSDLKYFIGKSTEDLIEITYKRIKDLKLTYKLSHANPKNRFSVRVKNIQKRILLLIRHMSAK